MKGNQCMQTLKSRHIVKDDIKANIYSQDKGKN